MKDFCERGILMQLPHIAPLPPGLPGPTAFHAGQRGLCGADDTLRVARAALHHWEEPCLSGDPRPRPAAARCFSAGVRCGAATARTTPSARARLARRFRRAAGRDFYESAKRRGEKSEPRHGIVIPALGHGGAGSGKDRRILPASRLQHRRVRGDGGGCQGAGRVCGYLAGGTTSTRTVRWLPMLSPPRRTTLPWPTPPFARCFCRPVRR